MKTIMLISATALLFFSVCTTKACALNGTENMVFDNEYSFIKEFNVTSPLNLSVSTSGGNINTTGREGNTVEVAFIVTQRGKVLDITFDQLKEYADVEIINENSRLEINVKKMFQNKTSISFSIKTPVNTTASLFTSGGNINISGITGKQVVKTSGGNLGLDNITGDADARTSGGNISISNSAADFNARTSGGNISLENIDGKLDVFTSGGNINADGIKKGILAKTSGGNIKLSKVMVSADVSTSGGEINLEEISGSVKASTSGGNIKADIINLTELLDLKTSGGSLHATIPSGLGLDLDLSAENINTPLSNFNGTSKKDRVIGKMNGGGITVHLQTSGGNITLNYK